MALRVSVWIGSGIGLLALIGGIAVLWYRNRNLNMFTRQLRAVYKAGYQDQSVTINGGTIAYLEGPDNGPALLLIHGQAGDKLNYAPTLPELARSFHVFAIDCYGHGQSSHDPVKYTNIIMGQDLLSFIQEVIGEETLVAGHSSGGIIATWLAAYGNEWVKGALFEDPPFFTLSRSRAETTWNWVDLASTAHNFLESQETDWVMYHASQAGMWHFFGDSKERFIAQARQYHAQHPTEPIKWAWLPPHINESFRAIPNYDPRFGDVFYQGSWEEGFELEAALKATTIPTIYQKSEAKINADGILQGATSDVEATRARELLNDVSFYIDNTAHSWHWKEPQEFVSRLQELRQRSKM